MPKIMYKDQEYGGIADAAHTMYDDENTELDVTNVQDAIDEIADGAAAPTFTSADVGDGEPTAWTSVPALASGETHKSILQKTSQMFKNIRYLWKMMGNTDISSIGDGTVTNAISTLNSNKQNNFITELIIDKFGPCTDWTGTLTDFDVRKYKFIYGELRWSYNVGDNFFVMNEITNFNINYHQYGLTTKDDVYHGTFYIGANGTKTLIQLKEVTLGDSSWHIYIWGVY